MSKYNESEPYSFGGKSRLAEYVGKKKADDIISRSDIYTRFKQHRKTKKYSPIYVYNRRELFQSDVVFFTNKDMVEANNGYRYLFTTIDVFTKMAWVYPIKANTCQNIMDSFKDILRRCGKKPKRLNTDRGSEMICKKFKEYLKEKKIHHYLAYSVRKCPVVERFNLTIQQLLYKIMAKNNTLSWVKYIDQAMKIYLNRKHRTIQMSPIEGDKKEKEKHIREIYLNRYKKLNRVKRNPKFKVGDTVRIWGERLQFHRGYMEDFTCEFFIIAKVLRNLPFPRYDIREYEGEEIIGRFFEDELVKYIPSDTYPIEVLKKKKTKKGEQYFVHYIGWPHSYDEWKLAKDIEKLT